MFYPVQKSDYTENHYAKLSVTRIAQIVANESDLYGDLIMNLWRPRLFNGVE